MPCHLRLQPVDAPAGLPQPQAQFGFLAGNQILAKAADPVKGRAPHQRVPAAGQRLAHRGVPFRVAECVVDAGLRKPFAAPPAGHGGPGGGFQKGPRGGNPALAHLAIAIDELQVCGALRPQPRAARIAGAGRREGLREIQFDDAGPGRAGNGEAVIRRPGIHIDDLFDLPGKRREAGEQPFALVAADHDGGDIGGLSGRRVGGYVGGIGHRAFVAPSCSRFKRRSMILPLCGNICIRAATDRTGA